MVLAGVGASSAQWREGLPTRAHSCSLSLSSLSVLIRAARFTAPQTLARIRSGPAMRFQRISFVARVHSSAGRSTLPASKSSGLTHCRRRRATPRNRIDREARRKQHCRARNVPRTRVHRAAHRIATGAAASSRLRTEPNAESDVAARMLATTPARRRPRTRVRQRQRWGKCIAAQKAAGVNCMHNSNRHVASVSIETIGARQHHPRTRDRSEWEQPMRVCLRPPPPRQQLPASRSRDRRRSCRREPRGSSGNAPMRPGATLLGSCVGCTIARGHASAGNSTSARSARECPRAHAASGRRPLA